MTAAQRDALAAELAELEGPKRAELVEAIATARGFGASPRTSRITTPRTSRACSSEDRDPAASSGERRLVEQAEDGVVGVGSVVEVEDESGGRFEVEISSVAGGVSTDSPLGSALVGSKVGDAVRVQAPKGPWTAR